MAGAVTGFGALGDAGECYNVWARGMNTLESIKDSVASDSVNTERYVEELTKSIMEMMHVLGKMMEQEQMSTVHMITTMSRSGESQIARRGIMEYRVINNLRAVNGDKRMFRQWHQKFTTAIGQASPRYEEMVHYMVREIDLGKDLRSVMTKVGTAYGEMTEGASRDIWKVLIDKSEAEAYDKIKTLS